MAGRMAIAVRRVFGRANDRRLEQTLTFCDGTMAVAMNPGTLYGSARLLIACGQPWSAADHHLQKESATGHRTD